MKSSTCLIRIKYGLSSLPFIIYILCVSYLSVFFIQEFITLSISLLMIGFYFYEEMNYLFHYLCKDWFHNGINHINEEYEMFNRVEHISFCSDSLSNEKSKKRNMK